MPSLGFTIEANFKRQPAPHRRGVGGKIDDVDSLVVKKEERSPVRIYIRLALLGAVAVALFALRDQAVHLLRSLIA